MVGEDAALVEIGSRYEIDRQIGAGGFSTVYRAVHRYTTDVVAIKVTSPGLEKHALEVFQREAEFLVQLKRQPNIVRVTDAGPLADGRFYLVMDYYETSFDQIEGLTVDEVLVVGKKLADALGVIHEKNIIHKDVKPANIFATDQLEPALGDFGIATGGQVDRSRTIQAFSFNYAAPEIFLGGPAEPPRDIYALGATLYHFLEGESPLARLTQRGQSAEQLAGLISKQEPPPFTNPDVTADLADAIFSCLDKQPAARPTAADLSTRLGQVAQDRRARPGDAPSVSVLPRLPSSPGPAPRAPLGRPPDLPVGQPEPPPAAVVDATEIRDRHPTPASAGQQPSDGPNAGSSITGGATDLREVGPAPDGAEPHDETEPEARPTSPDGFDGAATLRGRTALGLVAALVAFVVVGAVFFQSRRDRSVDQTASTDDPVEEASESEASGVLFPPESITVAANDDGTFTLSWADASTVGQSYWVSLVNSDLAEGAEGSPHEWTTAMPDGVASCFQLSTVGPDGMSFPSAPVCG